MRCEDVQNLLAAYLDGGIAEAETRAAIRDHLAGCALCRAEREALVGLLAEVSTTLKAAGDAIIIPDAPFRGLPAAARQPQHSANARRLHLNHHRSKSRMDNLSTTPNLRNGSRLAGGLLFAISLAMLFGMWLIFNVSATRGPAAGPEATVTPTPALTPTATVAPTATVNPLLVTGGFTEDALDVSTLPEYSVPLSGGGGGGGGGPCPDTAAPVETYASNMHPDSVEVVECLYDVPGLTVGESITIRLVSPAGRAYTAVFDVQPSQEIGLLQLVRQGSPDSTTVGTIATGEPRNPIQIALFFPAIQEFGDWQIEGSQAGVAFASGAFTVSAEEPTYSVTRVDEPLDPFTRPLSRPFAAGDRVIFVGRGLPPSTSRVLALYCPDDSRTTDTTTVFVPVYAATLGIDAEGVYRAEFVVGSETRQTWYVAVFDPQPEQWQPQPFGLQITQP